jgi:N-formylglutamate amidohydrolase
MSNEEPARTTDMADPELDPAFEIVEPSGALSPLVLSSPHSGAVYPRRFLASARLDAAALRRSEDAFVDDLFAGCALAGAPMLRARFPRAYLDVNREPFELDPRMFEGRLPGYINSRSLRVAGGLGTIARVVGESQEIYAGRLKVAEGLDRIERLYRPYHAALRSLLDRAHRLFGFAVLVDCHSMPSVPQAASGQERRIGADFVVGDRYGTSSDPTFMLALEGALEGAGFSVQRNKPYAGGFITEHYGRPRDGFHALQIEINRSLYMDERALQRHGHFARLQNQLTGILLSLTDAAASFGRPRDLAAE